MADAPLQISTLVVKRTEGVSQTQIADTPGGTPNILLKALSPFAIVFIRSARVFVQTLAGSVTVATFSSHTTFKAAFVIAAATAGVTALQNTAELLAKLDQSMPELRG